MYLGWGACGQLRCSAECLPVPSGAFRCLVRGWWVDNSAHNHDAATEICGLRDPDPGYPPLGGSAFPRQQARGGPQSVPRRDRPVEDEVPLVVVPLCVPNYLSFSPIPPWDLNHPASILHYHTVRSLIFFKSKQTISLSGIRSHSIFCSCLSQRPEDIHLSHRLADLASLLAASFPLALHCTHPPRRSSRASSVGHG